MKRNLNDMPCNPLNERECDAVTQAAVRALLTGHSDRDALQSVAQTVWANGVDARNLTDARSQEWEAEFQSRLEALLCTLDRFNDL